MNSRVIILCLIACFQIIQTAEHAGSKRKTEETEHKYSGFTQQAKTALLPALYKHFTPAQPAIAKPKPKLNFLAIPSPATAKGPQSPIPDKSDFVATFE